MEKQIFIFDTTLRDGEQVPGCKLNTKEKLRLALQLEELGVDVIEAGFPISSPGDFESVTEISKIIRNATVCGLTRAVQKDIEVAGEALKYAKKPRIHTGIGTSDFHIKSKFNTTREEILRRAVQAVKWARNYTDDVEFFAEDAGRTDNDYLAQVVEAVIAAGATVVNIPDTTGYCLPSQYGEKMAYLYTNIQTQLLNPISRLVSETMRVPVQPNKAIVGANAFSHSSGIHQDGFLKNAQTYEIISPEEVGAEGSKIVLTARSGRSALAYRFQKLGYDFTRDDIDVLYENFLQVADRQKEVEEEHLNEMAKAYKESTVQAQ